MSGSLFRLSIFVALWTMLALAECYRARSLTPSERGRRWPINLGLGVLDTACLRLLMPWLAVDAAHWAAAREIGLLNLLSVPGGMAAAMAFIILDLTIYFQHRLMHHVPWLWRLHRIHHTDTALDVSSGTRFHPIEIVLSMMIKIATVIVIGASPFVVLAFEIVLSSFSLVTHANIAIPERLDRALRWVFVTPDMHRIHHSVFSEEHCRNYSFHLSWWDRLFRTYLPAPALPQTSMPLGLTQFRLVREQGFQALLKMPFLPS